MFLEHKCNRTLRSVLTAAQMSPSQRPFPATPRRPPLNQLYLFLSSTSFHMPLLHLCVCYTRACVGQTDKRRENMVPPLPLALPTRCFWAGKRQVFPGGKQSHTPESQGNDLVSCTIQARETKNRLLNDYSKWGQIQIILPFRLLSTERKFTGGHKGEDITD